MDQRRDRACEDNLLVHPDPAHAVRLLHCLASRSRPYAIICRLITDVELCLLHIRIRTLVCAPDNRCRPVNMCTVQGAAGPATEQQEMPARKPRTLDETPKLTSVGSEQRC
jgi:hypothetical protein